MFFLDKGLTPASFWRNFRNWKPNSRSQYSRDFPQIWAFCTFSLTMTWSIFDASDVCFFLLLSNFLSLCHPCFSGSLLRRVRRALTGSGTLVEMLWGWGAKSEPRAQFLDVWVEKNGLELAMLKVMVDSYGHVWKQGDSAKWALNGILGILIRMHPTWYLGVFEKGLYPDYPQFMVVWMGKIRF